jgi:hypothetical protein
VGAGELGRAVRMLRVPRLHDGAVRVTVCRMLAFVDQEVTSGTPLCDLRVDLTDGQELDCPPFFHTRLICLEAGSVSEVCVRDGDVAAVGDTLLVLVPSGPSRAAEPRALRVQHFRILPDPFDL